MPYQIYSATPGYQYKETICMNLFFYKLFKLLAFILF